MNRKQQFFLRVSFWFLAGWPAGPARAKIGPAKMWLESLLVAWPGWPGPNESVARKPETSDWQNATAMHQKQCQTSRFT